MGRQSGSLRALWRGPWTTATKVAAVFVVPAVFAGWLGASDVSSALTFGGRIEGGFLLAASNVLAFGIPETFLYQRGSARAGVTCLAAAIVAALVALLGLFIEAVQSERRGPVVGGCAVLLAAAGWAIWRVRRSGVRFPYPKSLAAAVVIPALLAITNLVYSDVYQPSILPKQLSVSTSIGDPSMTPGRHEASLPVTIVFKNNSQNKLLVLMTTYSVIGWRNTAVQGSTATKLRAAVADQQPYSAAFRPTDFQLLQSGQFLPFSTIEAGDSVTVTDLLPVQYDEISVDASAFLLQANRATVASNFDRNRSLSWAAGCTPDRGTQPCGVPPRLPSWVGSNNVDFVRFQAPLGEPSSVRRFTLPRRLLTGWWVLAPPSVGNPGGPYLDATIARAGAEDRRPSPAYYQQLSREYGFQLTNSGSAERAVSDLKLPTAAFRNRVASTPPSTAPPSTIPPSTTPPPTGSTNVSGVASGVTNRPTLSFTGARTRDLTVLGCSLIAIGMTMLLFAKRRYARPGLLDDT